MNKKNRVDVYVASLPESSMDAPIYPEERCAEILSVTDETARREKYFVWRLLEHAVKASLGCALSELGLNKKNGKWTSDKVEMSLSHAGRGLVVALSGSSVGVDIEPLQKIDRDRVAHRFLTKRELSVYSMTENTEREESFLRIWTAKEAIFKSRSEQAFAPSTIDSTVYSVYTDKIIVGGDEYIISAFTLEESEINLYNIIL